MNDEPVKEQDIEQVPEGTPTDPENVSSGAESYDKFGFEFNAKIADVIASYEDKLPIFFMGKIIQNIGMDLIFKQVAIQMQYGFREFEKSQSKKKILL